MVDSVRTFIAVDIPQQIKMEIDKLIGELRPLAPDIRWVKAANLHLTLRFLGDIPKSSIGGLAEGIGKNISDFEAFHLALAGIGGFPNIHKPRVIWLGGGEGQDNLYNLAPRIEKACNDCGFGKADKPFSSHLTIGRVKFPKGNERLVSYIQNLKFESPIFPVEEVVIFKSDLQPSGPRYTRLETVRLRPA
jgi:RNA 2',3'-cyclic 3'-phosphodiesterase